MINARLVSSLGATSATRIYCSPGVLPGIALRQIGARQHPHTGLLPQLQRCLFATRDRQPQEKPGLGAHVTGDIPQHLVGDRVFFLIETAVFDHVIFIRPDPGSGGLQRPRQGRTGVGTQLFCVPDRFRPTRDKA